MLETERLDLIGCKTDNPTATLVFIILAGLLIFAEISIGNESLLEFAAGILDWAKDA
jgi:hypothetical protein